MPGSPPWPNPATEGTGTEGARLRADIAAVAAAAGAALRDAGLPVGPEQCQRFARAITLMHQQPPAERPAAEPRTAEAPTAEPPAGESMIVVGNPRISRETHHDHETPSTWPLARGLSARELRACGLATLVTDPEQIEVFDRVFAALFGGAGGGPAGLTGLPGDTRQPVQQHPPDEQYRQGHRQPPEAHGAGPDALPGPGPGQPRPVPHRPDPARNPARTGELRVLASAAERLGGRDFADLSPDELGQLEALMRQFALTTPLRRTRRRRRAPTGNRADLRTTLRQARRTHGEPVKLARTAARARPRRLVVLCDISGSMEPYARAMLQLLYCVSRAGRGAAAGAARSGGAAGGGARGPAGAVRTEVFTFATRLTRITPELEAADFGTVLGRAGKAAPDWSGGTRIGAALKEFNDCYGSRGMARGAVVLIISDGWETGDPARLGDQMARLSRVAHRIVWANPRTKSPRYRPEVGGMAAAWPYCDVVVSAHSLDALGGLLAALAGR